MILLEDKSLQELNGILTKIPGKDKVTVAVPLTRNAGTLLSDQLKAMGLKKVKERECFSKKLNTISEFPNTPFQIYCNQETDVIRCLSKSLGSLEEARSMVKALHEEVEQEKFRIYHAVKDGQDAGVFISHIEPFTKDEGRLFYFGLTPEFRGKGLAAVFHRFALAAIKLELDAESYIGVTDADNSAMKRVFLQNDCTHIQTIEIFSI